MKKVAIDQSEKDRPIPNTEEITSYFHCAKCLNERPSDVSPRDWARVSVGFTRLGVQVWCARHDCNIIHIDFMGQKVAVNTTIPK